jgi:prenyltransferase beta subunit
MRTLFAFLGSLAWLSLDHAICQAQRIPDEYKPVIEKSLVWLAKQQNQDGSWSNLQKQSDVTCTALAGLALLMEGSTAVKGKCAENIREAVTWMVQNCQEGKDDGLFGANARRASFGDLSGQSYAVLFLACALARDDRTEAKSSDERVARARRHELERVLKRAAAFIVKAQAKNGGWGLTSSQAGQDNAGSTLEQILALRAAQQAGIDVPKGTLQKAYAYLEKMTTPRGGIPFSSVQAGSSGAERPGLTIAAVAATYGSDEIGADVLKKWLRFSQSTISPRSQTQDLFHLAIAVHGLGDAGYAKLFSNEQPMLVWSRVRGIVLNRFRSEGGAIYREWNPSPVFGTAISLIVLQLDNDYLPIFRTKKDW